MTGRRPRVLVVTPDFPPARGGIQTLLGEVVGRFDDVTPRVVTFATPGWETFDAQHGFGTVRIARGGGSQVTAVLRLNARGTSVGLTWRPDAILSGHAVMAPATRALQRMLRVPVVQYAHANEFEGRPRTTAAAVRAAEATVAVSRYTARLAVEAGARPERVHVVHPGVAAPGFPRRPRERRPTLLSVARLTEANKGHDVVLDALPRVRERVPDVRWVVVGDGPLRPELERRAADRGLAGAIEFAGGVSDAERDAWFERAHVFVLPSRPRASGGGGEGFGIVYLEAAAHGLPVVAADVGGALDAVEDGETGLLVDPEDADAVAESLIGLLEDPARARALGRAGAERARTFTWDAAAARVQELLLEAVA